MKKIVLTSLCMAFAGLSSALTINQSMSMAQQIYHEDLHIVNVMDLDAKITEGFFNRKLPDLILECSEGINLPFDLHLSGEFLAIESEVEQPPYRLKILKTCYVKMGDKGECDFLFSSDLKEWKDFQNFFTGTMGFSVNDQSHLKLNIELNPK